MRYSMLVYITRMSKTLLEAAQYLHVVSEDSLREELLENGRRMLGQIGAVLEQHSHDLHSETLWKQLAELEMLWENGGEALEEQLKRFVQVLPKEISYQVRAVFFAELGEKWDAMESVYEYMQKDSRFDPVVVRTPVGRVTEKNGERRQEIIYRDFLSPIGIPSLGYEQYDIENDCPDLAFISQPYESCTLEQFWPENIAKQTRLVYLPYFLPSIVLSDYPNVLCQMRIYDVAWKVIGSNHKHYKYYCKYAHNGGANMIVTGVPKLDPIIKAKERGISLPEGWKKLQQKNIVLWNSWFDPTVSSLRFFDDILSWFQSHTDCALIWRPHPMTKTIFKVYYPEQYPTFQQYISQIEATSNAVLDREASYLPAFVYSDAQISDHSSLMQQYLPMNKPLLWISTLSSAVTGKEFISTEWMERGNSKEDVLQFLDRISRGEDSNAKLREEVYKKDLHMADGHCGERVCETLWKSLHVEDNIDIAEHLGGRTDAGHGWEDRS